MNEDDIVDVMYLQPGSVHFCTSDPKISGASASRQHLTSAISFEIDAQLP